MNLIFKKNWTYQLIKCEVVIGFQILDILKLCKHLNFYEFTNFLSDNERINSIKVHLRHFKGDGGQMMIDNIFDWLAIITYCLELSLSRLRHLCIAARASSSSTSKHFFEAHESSSTLPHPSRVWQVSQIKSS